MSGWTQSNDPCGGSVKATCPQQGGGGGQPVRIIRRGTISAEISVSLANLRSVSPASRIFQQYDRGEVLVFCSGNVLDSRVVNLENFVARGG